MGIVGLETAFPVLYTHLVRTGVLTLDKPAGAHGGQPQKALASSRCARTIMPSGT